MTERLLQSKLEQRHPGQFLVESAGTGALVGNPIEPRIAEGIRALGGSADDFGARQLSSDLLQQQDLILALTRAHRSRVVEMAPSQLRRTFTLKEYSRLLSHVPSPNGEDPAADWKAASNFALRIRGKDGPVISAHDDVPDPYGRQDEVYEEAQRQIATAVDNILTFYQPASPGRTI